MCQDEGTEYVITPLYWPLSSSCLDTRLENVDTSKQYIGGELTDQVHIDNILPLLIERYPEHQVLYHYTYCLADGTVGTAQGERQYGKYMLVIKETEIDHLVDDCEDLDISETCGVDPDTDAPLGECVNGERMTDEDPTYQCNCNPTYEFRDSTCQKRQTCNDNPCQNGGDCFLRRTTGYYCACPVGWMGQNCDEVAGNYVVSVFHVPMTAVCPDTREEDVDTSVTYVGGEETDRIHMEIILPELIDRYPENQIIYNRTVCLGDGQTGENGARQFGRYWWWFLNTGLLFLLQLLTSEMVCHKPPSPISSSRKNPTF